MQKEKRARKAKLAKEKIVADRKARHQHVVHCHLALLKDAEAREAAGLDFLPCAAEFLELDSVKRLWYSERSKLDLKGTLEPHYPSIAAEVNRAERGLRAALFDKSVSTLRRETTVANKTPPDGNIPPSSLLPTLPAPLGDKSTFTSAQKDEILSRATTLFSCQGRLGSWRSLFDHDCPVAFDRSLKVRNYSLCPLNLQGAAVVVQAAGKNIDTATAEEMDALGIAFTCESCRSATDENLSVPWTQMVSLARRISFASTLILRFLRSDTLFNATIPRPRTSKSSASPCRPVPGLLRLSGSSSELECSNLTSG